MEDPSLGTLIIQFVPLLIMTSVFGVVAHLLAKEKGRKVVLWTILGAIPFVNFCCLPFFVGAANLRLETKIDELLGRRQV